MAQTTVKPPKGYTLQVKPPKGYTLDPEPGVGFAPGQETRALDPNTPFTFGAPPTGTPGPMRKKVRSRWDDAVDRAASGLASTTSGLLLGRAGLMELGGEHPIDEPHFGMQTQKQRAAIQKRKKRITDASQFLWEVSRDPELAAQNTDIISKGLNLAAETVPYITATTASYLIGGPLGGFATAAMVEGNSSYRTALDAGVPEEQATKIGAMVGVAAGAIEAFGGRGAEQLLTRVAGKIQSKMGRTGAIFGIGTVIEALEEGGQEIAAITGEKTYRDVNWEEATNRTLGSMAGGAFLGGAMKGGGLAIRGAITGAERAKSPTPQVEERTTFEDAPSISPAVAQRAAEMKQEGWTDEQIQRNLIDPSQWMGDKAVQQTVALEPPTTAVDRRQAAEVAEMDRKVSEIQRPPEPTGAARIVQRMQEINRLGVKGMTLDQMHEQVTLMEQLLELAPEEGEKKNQIRSQIAALKAAIVAKQGPRVSGDVAKPTEEAAAAREDLSGLNTSQLQELVDNPPDAQAQRQAMLELRRRKVPPRTMTQARAMGEKAVHRIRKMTPEEIAEDETMQPIIRDILERGPDKAYAVLDVLSKRLDLLEKVTSGVLTQEEADVVTQKFTAAAKLRISQEERPRVRVVSREVKAAAEPEGTAPLTEEQFNKELDTDKRKPSAKAKSLSRADQWDYYKSQQAPKAKAAQKTIEALHEAPARTKGFELARDAEARAYFKNLRNAAKDKNILQATTEAEQKKAESQIIKAVDNAEDLYFSGDFASAVAESEKALQWIHERATIQHGPDYLRELEGPTVPEKAAPAAPRVDLGAVTDEELSGVTKRERRKLLTENAAKIEGSDIYQTEAAALEVQSREIGPGYYYVDPKFKGEVETIVGERRGFPTKLQRMFTFDRNDTRIVTTATGEKAEIGPTPWDTAVQEGLGRGREGVEETSGYMDIAEFVQRVVDASRAEETIGGINVEALERAQQSGDPDLWMLAEKHKMLAEGASDQAINDMITEWADEWGIELADVEDELVAEFGTKLRQIKKLDDPEDALEDLATRQIEEEDRRAGAEAAREVLKAAGIEAEVREVEEIPERPQDLLGRPALEGGATGLQRGLGELGLEFTKPEPVDPDQLTLEDLPPKPEDDVPFERRDRPVAAALTSGERQLILVAIGADSESGYHEAFHVYRPWLTAKHHKILDRIFGGPGISARQQQEAEATSFARFAVTGKARGVLRAIWQKLLNLINKVKSGLRGHGFTTIGDLFAQIEKGTVEKQGARGAGTAFAYKGLSYEQILKRQRELEGLRAAMKDPKTGKVYSGASHVKIVDNIQDKDIRARIWKEFGEIDSDKVGFVDKSGKFITRDESERRWDVLTMEDVKDARAGRDRGQVQFETTSDKLRREAEKGARVRARKARLAEQAGIKRKVKKGPAIRRIKIKLQDHTPPLREDLAPVPEAKAELPEPSEELPLTTKTPSQVVYDEKWFEDNLAREKRSLLDRAGSEARAVWAGLDKVLGVTSTRLYNISPKLFRATRQYVYDVLTRSTAMTRDVQPFVAGAKKMSKNDWRRLDLALKNGVEWKIREVVGKYNLTGEYARARAVLDEIFEAAKTVGIDIDYLKEYWPRMLKDPEGFLQYVQGREDWSIIEEAIKRRAAQAGRKVEDLTVDEKAHVVNTLLRGYRTQALTLSRPGPAKERTVESVDKVLDAFYYDSLTSLHKYIQLMNTKIAEREFFGRETKEIQSLRKTQSARLTRLMKLKRRVGLKYPSEPAYKEHISKTAADFKAANERLERLKARPLSETIGGYVLALQASGEISPTQEKEIQGLLTGIFDPKGMGRRMGLFATGVYMDTLNSVLQTLTQLDEFAYAFYRSPLRSIPVAIRTAARRSRVTPEEIGIVSIGHEFQELNVRKALTYQLKVIGFEQIDRLNKENYINTALEDLEAKARKYSPLNPAKRKANAAFVKKLARVFGPEYKTVLEDLRAGRITEDVKYLLFNEILDIQPLAITEMPEAYNKAGNLRILYALKMFNIKRLDFARNEAFKDMKSPATFARGFGTMVWLAFSFALMGAGSDFLKDFVRGKPFDLKDSIVDNLLRMVFFSKYQAWRTRQKGLGTALLEGWRPPTKAIDSVTRDIINEATGKDRGWELWRSVPIGGELYYWWFGQGRRRTEGEGSPVD